ncbi:MAG TPA: aminoglycoside phosphotransferase family protein, partial [Chloroflexota bacterium]
LPAVHASTVWHDRPALLLSWCDGQTLLRAVVGKPWRTWSLGVAMGLQQARIHAAPVAETLGEVLPPWIARAAETDYALKERLASITRARQARALLHLDYHPLNVLTANGAVTCVLDWANAAIGDPRADVARTVSLLRLAPSPPGTPTALGFALRVLLELAWRTGYRRAAGRLGDMPAFYAWAGSMMERDLAPKVGQPGVWLQPSDLARIHQWTVTWKRQAGL